MKKHIVISSDGSGPFATRISTASGEVIHGVRQATVLIKATEPTTATLELLSSFNGTAEAEFLVRDPVSGQKKAVERIEFADGTTFPPHD